MTTRPILISAYACEPGKGSEPGLGWKLATYLAAKHPIIVLTRANNQAPIEEALASIAPENRPEFAYHDLGRLFLLLKKFLKAHRWYYFLWQRTAKQQVAHLVASRNVSIVHHATYASFRYPTAVLGHGVPAIWGPVGGIEATPWALMPWRHPVSLSHELARNIDILRHETFPDKRWSRYSRILAATEETRRFFSTVGITANLLPAIGIDEISEAIRPPEVGPLRLLFVGQLHHLKGVQFAIKALAGLDGTTMTVVGSGPFESALKRLVQRLRIQSRIHFYGHLPHGSLARVYTSHDVFVFPSLHDSGGMAVLEAMRSQLPVICLDCGGPALSVTNQCGAKIPLGSSESIALRIREAVTRYKDDRSLLVAHARSARDRVQSLYLWPTKIDRLLNIYRHVIEEHAS